MHLEIQLPTKVNTLGSSGMWRRSSRSIRNELFLSGSILHVNHEAVLDILLLNSMLGLVDIVHGDYPNICDYAMFGAEVNHFLGLLNTANQGACYKFLFVCQYPSD